MTDSTNLAALIAEFKSTNGYIAGKLVSSLFSANPHMDKNVNYKSREVSKLKKKIYFYSRLSKLKNADLHL